LTAVLSRVELGQMAGGREFAELRQRTPGQDIQGRLLLSAWDPGRFVLSVRATLAKTAAFTAPWAGAALGYSDRTIRSAAALLSRFGASVLSRGSAILVHRSRGAADPRRDVRQT
jgi:hypothetical protein